MGQLDTGNSPTPVAVNHLPAPAEPGQFQPQFCAGIAAGIALLALAGWLCHARVWAGQWASFIPMAPSTALALLLLSGAMFVAARWPGHRLSGRCALTAISLVTLLSFLVLGQAMTGVDPGIERVLSGTTQRLGLTPLGRMSPLAALVLLLESAALALLIRAPRRCHAATAAAGLAAIATVISMVILSGYAYGVPLLYGRIVIPMALPTALAFTSAGAGQIWMAWPASVALQAWSGSSLRGRLLRAFLRVMLLFIFIEGWVNVVLGSLWTGNPVLWHALMALGGCALMVGVITWIARRLGGELERADEELRRLSRVVEQTPASVVITDLAGAIEYVNPAFTASTGYTTEEAKGQNPRMLKSDLMPAETYTGMWRELTAGREWRGELQNRRKNGDLFWELAFISPLKDAQGRMTHYLAVKEDVTARKQLEECLLLTQFVMDHAADAISWIDTKGRFIYINEAMCESLGYSREELLQLSVPDINPEFPKDFWKQRWEEVPDDHVMRFETRHRAKDGRLFPVEVKSIFLRHRGQGFFCSFVRDISERKQAEEALRASEQHTRLLLESTGEGILGLDRQGCVMQANPAAVHMLGYDRVEELIGQRLHNLIHHTRPDGRRYSDADCPILKELTKGRSLRLDDELLWRRDGTSFVASYNAYPLRQGGQVVGHVVTIIDLTERKQAEQANRERQALQDAVAAMENVLGVVGHELRTPLAAVRAMSEFLVTDGARQIAGTEGFLKSIHDETIRMAEMVNNMLEAARLNSGVAQWNWGRVDWASVCDEALNIVRPLVDPARIELIGRVDPPGLNMLGDGEAIRRLIVNLLTNAAKNTTEGSITVAVSPMARTDESWVQLQVQDSGEGIGPDRLRKLGEAFALNRGVVGSNYIKGSGLGLAICRGIVAAHGGTITVASTVGRGTAMTVRLRADLTGPVQRPNNIQITQEVAA